MPPKVLFADAYPFHVAGAQMTLADLAGGLADSFAVSVATVADDAAAAAWRGAGLRVHIVPYPKALQKWEGALQRSGPGRTARNAVAALRHAAKCAALLRREKIDVLYCSNVRTVLTFGLGARLARVPSIWYVQQLESPMGKAHAVAARVASRVATISPRTERVFPRGLPRGRSVVIPLGIDVRRWSSPREAPAPPPLRLACVGQIHHGKGIDVILDALAVMRADGVDATLRIIGSATGAPDEGLVALQHQVTRLGLDDQVEWFGHTEDVAAALAPCHLIVSGSRREGVPRSLMEAMALGLPAVATDVGAVRDLVIDGVTGFVVPPDNPQALAEAVARYCEQPSLLGVHGAAAIGHVLAGFDLRQTVERFAAELAALAGRQ